MTLQSVLQSLAVMCLKKKQGTSGPRWCSACCAVTRNDVGARALLHSTGTTPLRMTQVLFGHRSLT